MGPCPWIGILAVFKDLIIVWTELALQLKIEPDVHRIVSHIVFLIIVFF